MIKIFDGFGVNLCNPEALKHHYYNNIIIIKEEGYASHVNQAYNILVTNNDNTAQRDSLGYLREITKNTIKSILLLCYKNNTSSIIKKGAMLKYLEAKFDEHPENMVSLQRYALTDVPAEELNDSLLEPIEEENESTSTQYLPEVYHLSYPIPVSATARNGHAHCIYFRVDESRAKMEHTLSTLDLTIQICQAIKIIWNNESGKSSIQILSKENKWGGGG